MKKTIQIIVMAVICLNFSLKAQEPINKNSKRNIYVQGKVIDGDGLGLPNASVKIKGTNIIVNSGSGGEFTIAIPENSLLEVSYVGYLKQELTIKKGTSSIVVILKADGRQLQEVVVNTGYQKLPQERATGSFELIDNKLFNRSTGLDVFSRLDGITTTSR